VDSAIFAIMPLPGPRAESIRGTTMKRQDHWNRIYETTAPGEVSWYQPEPTLSLRLIQAAGFTPST
jgi:hypothetical protein